MVISPEFPSTVTVPFITWPWSIPCRPDRPRFKADGFLPSSSTVAVDTTSSVGASLSLTVTLTVLTHLGAVVVGGGDRDGICSVEVGVRCVGDLAGVPSTVTVPLAALAVVDTSCRPDRPR